MNMTPMIDIVFLLIIFFMTVSQVSEVNRERLDLPQAEGIAGPEAHDVDDQCQRGRRDPRCRHGLSHSPDLIALVADELARLGDDPNKLTVVLRCRPARNQQDGEPDGEGAGPHGDRKGEYSRFRCPTEPRESGHSAPQGKRLL